MFKFPPQWKRPILKLPSSASDSLWSSYNLTYLKQVPRFFFLVIFYSNPFDSLRQSCWGRKVQRAFSPSDRLSAGLRGSFPRLCWNVITEALHWAHFLNPAKPFHSRTLLFVYLFTFFLVPMPVMKQNNRAEFVQLVLQLPVHFLRSEPPLQVLGWSSHCWGRCSSCSLPLSPLPSFSSPPPSICSHPHSSHADGDFLSPHHHHL